MLILAMAAVVWLIAAAGYALLGVFGLSTRKRLALTASTAAVCGLIIILQAAGQLTLKDLLGFLLVFAIAWLYISRFSLRHSP
ncbi:MAG: hypothetical protein JWM37_23 [Candidatus Saccharibacteria bacterium]|nr:hypothetical protein [Candidatus Saccharibacteria bacterium]